MRSLLQQHRPTAIVHFAAESHVDRSITGPAVFVEVNVVGTFNLLTEALAYWQALAPAEQSSFRFHHVSTDEVYGSLGPDDPAFTETTPYPPNSPYSASKAASRSFRARLPSHVRAARRSRRTARTTTGRYQFPEKLDPADDPQRARGQAAAGLRRRPERARLAVRRATTATPCGWCSSAGGPARRTTSAGDSEQREHRRRADDLRDRSTACSPSGAPHAKLDHLRKDRPGHDRRYAIDATRLRRELGWQPRTSFEQGMERTVQWYLDHMDWVRSVTSGAYRDWMKQNYADRDKS